MEHPGGSTEEIVELPERAWVMSGRGVTRADSPVPVGNRPPGLGLGYRRPRPTMPHLGRAPTTSYGGFGVILGRPGIGRGLGRATPALPQPSVTPGRPREEVLRMGRLPPSRFGPIGEVGPLEAQLRAMSLARRAWTTPVAPGGEGKAAGGAVPGGARSGCLFRREGLVCPTCGTGRISPVHYEHLRL